ncbi:hypothetical protein WJX77_011227 [Trebouxia sp. C0004]
MIKDQKEPGGPQGVPQTRGPPGHPDQSRLLKCCPSASSATSSSSPCAKSLRPFFFGALQICKAARQPIGRRPAADSGSPVTQFSILGKQLQTHWVLATALRPKTDQPQEPFAWVASANLRQVRQGELRQVRALLHQEERLLHVRRQELDPVSGRPLKGALPAAIMTSSHVLSHDELGISAGVGSHLPTWVLGDTYCGRERPGEPQGHKLCITFMQCTECNCKRAIALDAPFDDCWCPKQWQCSGCSKELHGATYSKAGSAIVVVH